MLSRSGRRGLGPTVAAWPPCRAGRAAPVDSTPRGGILLRSPAPAGRRGGQAIQRRELAREGPGRPVDNGARSRGQRDVLRSEGMAGPASGYRGRRGPARFSGRDMPGSSAPFANGGPNLRCATCARAPQPARQGSLHEITGPTGRPRRQTGEGRQKLAGKDVARTPVGRVAVIMPTYNERENLEAMAGRVRAAVPDADLLVVDDNSPDGTGELADKLAAEDTPRPGAAPAGQGRARRRVHRRLRLGAGQATAPRSRWTRTAHTSRSSCPSCWPRWRTPTWSSAPAGCRAGGR